MKPATSATSQTAKQVIYVDVDDEITAVIDKMDASDARVVALVLPKRSTVFQSIVNMKLLKRRADNARKNVVLITSESGLMPLAGLAGIHVAPTPQSKPYIPPGNLADSGDEDGREETASLADDEPADASGTDFDRDGNAGTAVGELSGAAAGSLAAAAGRADPEPEMETIQMDNSSKLSKLARPAAPPARKNPALPRDKNPKVPNFFNFRKRLLLGSLAVLLLAGGWYYAYFVMPKATITISTNSSGVSSRLALTLDTAASDIDAAKLTLPAQTKQEQKSNTQSVPTSGQDNRGDKATGNVVMTSRICGAISSPNDVDAGTGVSANGLTYITSKTASFGAPSVQSGCLVFKSDTVPITAQKGGANYNQTSNSFTVANHSDVSASGSTSSGTDNIVKTVQQSDIDAAKQKLNSAQDQTAIKNQLQDGLKQNDLYPLTATFYASEPNISTSSQVGDEADNVTVSQSVSYTMYGVKKADLQHLIDDDLKTKIDTSKQDILDDGLGKAKVSVDTPGAGAQQKIEIAVTASAGPKLDIASLRTNLVGLKTGQVQDRIKTTPGVQDVRAKYSPFWVTKAPKADKITIQFEKVPPSSPASGSAAGGADGR